MNQLLDKQFTNSKTLDNLNDFDCASKFATFDKNKVRRIYDSIQANDKSSNSINPVDFDLNVCENDRPKSLEFQQPPMQTVRSIIQCMPTKACCLDPLPIHLLKQGVDELLPAIAHIVNLSLSTGIFPDELKSACVTRLLKREALDRNDVSKYRPVSNLSFLSKLIEKCVNFQLTYHLSENHLFGGF